MPTDKRKKNWGNPIIDKLMKLKYRLNDAYHINGEDTKSHKTYVMKLIEDVRKHDFKRIAPEDAQLCNSLWKRFE